VHSSPVPQPTVGQHCFYYRVVDTATGKPATYFTQERLAMLTGRLRHGVGRAFVAAGTNDDWVQSYVHGHGVDWCDQRLSYVGFPDVQRGGGAFGLRVDCAAVVLPAGDARALQHLQAAGRLDCEAYAASNAVSFIPTEQPDFCRVFNTPARTWTTVTPVAHFGSLFTADWKSSEFLTGLASSALAQIDHDEAAIARVQVRSTPFYSSVLDDMLGIPANQYFIPVHMRGKFSFAHVRIEFDRDVTGPVLMGLGQFRGFGLFAGGV